MSNSPWGCKESDTTEQLTHTPLIYFEVIILSCVAKNIIPSVLKY